jgi:hypothetical protein
MDDCIRMIDSAWVGAHPGAQVWDDVHIQKDTKKEDPKVYPVQIDYSKDALTYPSLDFLFTNKPVTAELSTRKTVDNRMRQALFTGSVVSKVNMQMYMWAMKDNGLAQAKDEVE